MLNRVWLATIVLAICLQSIAQAHNGMTAVATSVQNITIDGDLADWPDQMKRYLISSQIFVCDGTPTENGFLGRYRIGCNYQENALYIAVEIEDDQVVLDGFGDAWNSRDSCEVFLTLDHNGQKSIPIQFVYRGKPSVLVGEKTSTELDKAVKVARSTDDTHIVYEWRIDLNQLREKPTKVSNGTVFGFDVSCVDRDAENIYAFYSASDGSQKHMDSSALGDLIVAPENSKLHQLAGRVSWNDEAITPIKTITLKAIENENIYIQFPANANGEFIAAVPAGDYDLSVVGARPEFTSSKPNRLSINQDTLLTRPVKFEFAELDDESKPLIYFDLAHGQSEPPALKQLSSELGFRLRSSKESISTSAIEQAKVLYLLVPRTEISADEIATMGEFVKNGGSLLLVMDESRRTSLQTTKANELIAPFGLKLTGDTEYVHNCGAVTKIGKIHKQKLEIPFSGGRAVEGGVPFAFQVDVEGKPSQACAAYVEVEGAGRVAVLSEAMAAIFLGTEAGERLSGTPRNYNQTQYWGKDSKQFNADLLRWLANTQ